MVTFESLKQKKGVPDRDPDFTVEEPGQISLPDDTNWNVLVLGHQGAEFWEGFVVDPGEGGIFCAVEE